MTDVDRARHRVRMMKWRAKRKALHLCKECSAPVRNGRAVCAYHQERQRLRARAYWRRKYGKPIIVGFSVLLEMRAKARLEAGGGLNWKSLSLETKTAVIYEKMLRDEGILTARVNEPPVGWSVEMDKAEEAIAFTEHLAMRKVS